MATTADSPSSPISGGGGESISSPQFRRKNPPWAQVVRGDSESISVVHHSPPSSSSAVSQPEQTAFSDCSPPMTASPSPPLDNSSAGEGSDGNDGNAARPKKLAWNKPSNGVVEVSPVMGAVSWPALSESTKASPKSSIDSSSKTVADAPVSSSQGPAVLHSPKKQVTATNVNSNSSTNHTLPARQRHVKRGSGGNNRGGHSQSGFGHPPQPPAPPPFPVFSIHSNGYHNLMPAVPDPSHREFPYRSSNWETRPAGGFVSQSHPVNDHRSPSRRGNSGPHQRGDGHYHNNHHGGRRDQERGNYANVRDVHMQPQRAPLRGFVRTPPNTAAFVTPQPVRPFVNHMGFHELYYMPTLVDSFRQYIPHPSSPALYLPAAEPLNVSIVKQIEYYFSDANLVKDDFLRSNMDDQGWVPITLIANFPRVKNLTTNIQLILDALRSSTVVEVQDDKLRRRDEWKKWIPASARLPSDSGSVSPDNSSYDTLTTSFQNITVDEVDTNQSSVTGKADPNSEAVPGRCFTESIGQSQLSNGEVTQNNHSSWN